MRDGLAAGMRVVVTWPVGVARPIGGLEGVLRQVKARLRPRAHAMANPRAPT